MGNAIKLDGRPSRIVSLVPSQTELLFDLGLDDAVTGITKFCVHPPHWLAQKVVVGGTKNFNFEIIDRLNPDLVIGNKEENYREGIETLKKKYQVWMSDIYSLEDACQMMQSIGSMTGTTEKAEKLVSMIRAGFAAFEPVETLTCLYLIWRKPWMAAGSDTFINDMLGRIGLQNCLPQGTRYPELTSEDLKQLNPDLLLLSSEPYPFGEKHIAELQDVLPTTTIRLVDGEMFSWYGSRLAKAVHYLKAFRGSLFNK